MAVRDMIAQVQSVYNPDHTNLQFVAVGAASAAVSNVIGANAVLLISTTACHVAFGASPTATTANFYLPANTPMAITCSPTDKVAVIQNAAGGYLFAAPLN
jgi:hypothetical protein